jgi:hypothetical protein
MIKLTMTAARPDNHPTVVPCFVTEVYRCGITVPVPAFSRYTVIELQEQFCVYKRTAVGD